MSADVSEKFSQIQSEIYHHGYDRGYQQGRADGIKEGELFGVTSDEEYIQYKNCLYKKVQEGVAQNTTGANSISVPKWVFQEGRKKNE